MSRYSEDAFNAFGVTYTDLNVSFGVESRPFVDRSALQKYAPDRINRHLTSFLPDVMQQPDHGAIKVAPERVRAVLGKRVSSFLRDFNEPLMGTTNMLHAGRRR